MQVFDIDIRYFNYDAVAARFQGEVSLRVTPPRGRRTVELDFLCHARQPRNCPTSIVTCSLIADALRQARRMPGFRRGEDRIEVVAPAPRIASRRIMA